MSPVMVPSVVNVPIFSWTVISNWHCSLTCAFPNSYFEVQFPSFYGWIRNQLQTCLRSVSVIHQWHWTQCPKEDCWLFHTFDLVSSMMSALVRSRGISGILMATSIPATNCLSMTFRGSFLFGIESRSMKWGTKADRSSNAQEQTTFS